MQKILERKVDLAIRGEKEAQQKLYQAEAEIEAKKWEKRNRDLSFQETEAKKWEKRKREHSFQEINQEFESHRVRKNHASRWADRAQREREN